MLAVGVPLALLAVACAGDDEPEGAGGSDDAASETTAQDAIDFAMRSLTKKSYL